MATLYEAGQIASNLPGAIKGTGRFGYSILVKGKEKGFIWSWLERVQPKKARVANETVLAIRVPNLQAKEMILATYPTQFFTEDHYNGYPAVLAKLEIMTADEIRPFIEEAWKCKANKEQIAKYFGVSSEKSNERSVVGKFESQCEIVGDILAPLDEEWEVLK